MSLILVCNNKLKDEDANLYGMAYDPFLALRKCLLLARFATKERPSAGPVGQKQQKTRGGGGSAAGVDWDLPCCCHEAKGGDGDDAQMLQAAKCRRRTEGATPSVRNERGKGEGSGHVVGDIRQGPHHAGHLQEGRGGGTTVVSDATRPSDCRTLAHGDTKVTVRTLGCRRGNRVKVVWRVSADLGPKRERIFLASLPHPPSPALVPRMGATPVQAKRERYPFPRGRGAFRGRGSDAGHQLPHVGVKGHW